MRSIRCAESPCIRGTVLALILSMVAPQLTCAEQVRDTCLAKVPKTAAEVLAQKFPGYRLPKMTDQSEEDRRLDMADGGDGCLMVANGDFSGHGRKDVAVLLISKDDTKVRLVAALRGRSSWTTYELPTWCRGPDQGCYVKVAEPGVYTRTQSLPAPSDPADKEKIESKNDGILAGKLESNGVVHVFKEGSWQHVWVSD